MKKAVTKNRRITIKELSDDFRISFAFSSANLTEDSNMRRVPAKFVPSLLTDERKEKRRLEAARDLFGRA